MSGILIENGVVLTVNSSDDVYQKGHLLIEDDRIMSVAEGSAPQDIRTQADEIIDAAGQIVMPGLVNAHVHLQQSLVRGLADDREVWDWVQNVAFPIYGAMNESEVHLATLVGMVENIRSGATATTDNQTVRSKPGNFDAAFRAAKDSGIRYKLARGFNERGVPEQFLETTESIMEDMTRLYERWHNQENGRLRLDFNPHTLFLVTENTLMRVGEKALEWGIGIHLHTAETQEEIDMFSQETGMRHVEWLADRELLGPQFQLAHAVWLSEREIEQIAASGATTVHNPVCNMFCGSGVSPVPQMLAAGIPVAMGTDGQACNNGQEMLDTFKWVLNMHKLNSGDATILSPEQVIRMACCNSAYAFGQPSEIGSLEPGKKADVIIVDLGDPRMTMPSLSVPSLLVNFAKSSDVAMTIVDGKILMQDKEILVVDEDQVLKEFRAARSALLIRAGVS
jgi:5-methylthioadenosine/S-adenosylhomocysteine deaminase|tara:strand:- start:2348 stop:3703 length:1356 start_codon:yes stop_codon:yes gene_type:complete